MNLRVFTLTDALATACGSVHRGVVAMKISDTAAHVCLNKDEVAVGDVVRLYRNVCRNTPRSNLLPWNCEKRALATCVVTEVLNEHYSVVTLPAGTEFKEGDFVERPA
ncbi:MAG: hypothetical protein U0797_07720 [Gemmataceae bacterium]